METRRLGDVAGQMVAAQSAAFEASSRARDSRAMPEVTNSPTVQTLKGLVAQSEGKLADLAKKVGPNHPEFQRLQAESNSYKIKLASELSTAARGVGASSIAARQRFNQSEGAFANQKTRVLGLKQQREEATLLARDLENAQRVYDSALQRYGQSRMEAQSTQTDISILDPAVAPASPSKPNVYRNVLLSVFLGSLLGIGTGFLVELLDRRLRSKQDIADGLGVSVLA